MRRRRRHLCWHWTQHFASISLMRHLSSWHLPRLARLGTCHTGELQVVLKVHSSQNNLTTWAQCLTPKLFPRCSMEDDVACTPNLQASAR
jgi:hypothetical protein